MKSRSPQREITVKLGGRPFSGRYEVHDFTHSGHRLVVYYRGKTAEDTIPPEANYPSYTDFLGEQLLMGLIAEEESSRRHKEEQDK